FDGSDGDEPLAGRDVDVGRARRTGRAAEVERPAVPREGRTRLARGGVHVPAQVHGRAPVVVRALAGRHPDVLAAETAEAVGGEDHLAPVAAHVGLDVDRGTAQLRDQLRRTEAAVAVAPAAVDVTAGRRT